VDGQGPGPSFLVVVLTTSISLPKGPTRSPTAHPSSPGLLCPCTISLYHRAGTSAAVPHVPHPHRDERLHDRGEGDSRERERGTLCRDKTSARAQMLLPLAPHERARQKGDTKLSRKQVNAKILAHT